jgi:hypothetical protein
MEKLVEVLGTPSKMDWPDAFRLAERWGYKIPNKKGKGLEAALIIFDVD